MSENYIVEQIGDTIITTFVNTPEELAQVVYLSLVVQKNMIKRCNDTITALDKHKQVIDISLVNGLGEPLDGECVVHINVDDYPVDIVGGVGQLSITFPDVGDYYVTADSICALTTPEYSFKVVV